jgi:hypothetical protein
VRSLVVVAVLLAASQLGATSITQTSTYVVTPVSGYQNCSSSAGSCLSGDPQGPVFANAIANASAGSVRVELRGGAALFASTASASAYATNAESYLFTNGIGSGTLQYSVALAGFSTGNPHEPAAVRFNGASYSVLPYAAPTYYSFTQRFTYWQPVLLMLSVEMASAWDGARGDGGSRFASAQLVGMNIASDSVLAASMESVGGGGGDVPEPSVAAMWLGGGALLFAGLRRKARQR